MLVQIKKHKNGYYVRRYFDGKNGIPKTSFYLNKNGTWTKNKLINECFFPNRELAQSFLNLRCICEDKNREIRRLKWTIESYEMDFEVK